MHRVIAGLRRRLGPDEGVSSVEYAIATAIVIAVGVLLAGYLGVLVFRPVVTIAGVPGPRPSGVPPEPPARTAFVPPRKPAADLAGRGAALWPWLLVSLACTVGFVAAVLAAYKLTELLARRRARRKLRCLLAGGQTAAALDRMTVESGAGRVVPLRFDDTRLIGRGGPSLDFLFGRDDPAWSPAAATGSPAPARAVIELHPRPPRRDASENDHPSPPPDGRDAPPGRPGPPRAP